MFPVVHCTTRSVTRDSFRWGLDARGQLLPAAHRRGVGQLGGLPIDLPLRPARQHLFEGHAALETSEARAEAEVDAEAEAQMADVPAPHVEAVGMVELALVAVRRAVEQQQRGALGQ